MTTIYSKLNDIDVVFYPSKEKFLSFDVLCDFCNKKSPDIQYFRYNSTNYSWCKDCSLKTYNFNTCGLCKSINWNNTDVCPDCRINNNHIKLIEWTDNEIKRLNSISDLSKEDKKERDNLIEKQTLYKTLKL